MTWPSDVTVSDVIADTGVNYLAPEPGSGYGEAAEDYMTALRAAGVPVRWTPLAWGSDAWGPDHIVAPVAGADFGSCRHGDICNAPIACDTMIVHCPPLWYEPWSQRRDTKRRIAYTTWETDRLPPEKAAILNRYDMVLVPSTHNENAFCRSGVTAPIRVVPHAARPVPVVHGGQFSDLGDDVFVFYVINTWSARKALPETILAFAEAFTAADPVVLIVKTTVEDHVALGRIIRGIDQSPGRHAGLTWWTLAHLLAGRSHLPRIRLVPGELPRQVIDELHTRGDCFVSLTRGEGWGMGAFEAAAYGRPVVITGWGGHRDFLGPDYPYYVDYRLVRAAEDEADDWYAPDPSERWARPDVAHASALLRRIYENQDEARARGGELRRSVTANFSSEKVGALLLAALYDQ